VIQDILTGIVLFGIILLSYYVAYETMIALHSVIHPAIIALQESAHY
jgi:hypothetical protein